MGLREIMVGGKAILVEVAELPLEGKSAGREGFEPTSAREKVEDLADRVKDVVGVLTLPIQAAFEGSGAQEWSIEINFGFKGETGLPFVAKGEANAAVKVTAKWKKGA